MFPVVGNQILSFNCLLIRIRQYLTLHTLQCKPKECSFAFSVSLCAVLISYRVDLVHSLKLYNMLELKPTGPPNTLNKSSRL